MSKKNQKTIFPLIPKKLEKPEGENVEFHLNMLSLETIPICRLGGHAITLFFETGAVLSCREKYKLFPWLTKNSCVKIRFFSLLQITKSMAGKGKKSH